VWGETTTCISTVYLQERKFQKHTGIDLQMVEVLSPDRPVFALALGRAFGSG